MRHAGIARLKAISIPSICIILLLTSALPAPNLQWVGVCIGILSFFVYSAFRAFQFNAKKETSFEELGTSFSEPMFQELATSFSDPISEESGTSDNDFRPLKLTS